MDEQENRGDTVIEYKNCIVRAISLNELQLLVGNPENLFIDCPCEELGNGLVRINVLQKYAVPAKQLCRKNRSLGKTTRNYKAEERLYPLPLSDVKRMSALPRSVSALFSKSARLNSPMTNEGEWKTTVRGMPETSARKEFPDNQYVILPNNAPEKQKKKIDQYTDRVKSRQKTARRVEMPSVVGALPKIGRKVIGYSPVQAMQLTSREAGRDALKAFFGENIPNKKML